MASKLQKKYSNVHPDIVAINKYEQDIKRLEKQREEADKAHDWPMRNFCDAQLRAKRGNLQELKNKINKRYFIS